MSVSTAPVRLTVRRFGETDAPRRVVDPAPRRVPRLVDLPRLLDVGGVPGRPLHVRPVPLAVLLSGNFRHVAAQLVRSEAGGVARVAAVFAGAADPADPGFFRLTCYYYRGAYYKAFWADPPSCTVGEPRSSYWGENSFPLDPAELPPLHAVSVARRPRSSCTSMCGRRSGSPIRRPGTVSFGIGVGTLVLATNVVLLSGYLFGCHSMRHVVGGCVDQLSRAPLGLQGYSCVSCLNRRHMVWAWCSLFTVGFSDLYVRLCSMGVWSDVRIL